MPRLSDINNGAIKTLLGYRNNVRAVLAITTGGSAATVKTTNAFEYVNNGVQKTKAAFATQAVTVTHNWNGSAAAGYVQPVSTTVYYTIGLDGSGNVCVAQGTYAGQKLSGDPTVGLGNSSAGATWVGNGAMPDVPAGYTAVGIIKITTDSTHTFTAGTTNLDAAGVTAAYYDIEVMPDGSL